MIEPTSLDIIDGYGSCDTPDSDFFLCPETYEYYPSLVIELTKPDRRFRIVVYPDNKFRTRFHLTIIGGTDKPDQLVDSSSSEMLDPLREERPECFEWLLFHPEWL